MIEGLCLRAGKAIVSVDLLLWPLSESGGVGFICGTALED